MNFFGYLILFFGFRIYASELANTCTSKYSNPQFQGTCMPVEACLGGALVGICEREHVCCIKDTKITTKSNTYELFTKIFGSTVRNVELSKRFNDSLTTMRLTSQSNCSTVAAFMAHIKAETKNLTLFEEPETQVFQNDKYRGRGALMLRGQENYQLANASGMFDYDLLLQPDAAALPSVAFRIAEWIWTKNSYPLVDKRDPVQKNLNEVADNTLINFLLLTHSFTRDVKEQQMRAAYMKEIMTKSQCGALIPGKGIQCDENGHAVPSCFDKEVCNCHNIQKNSCPYGTRSDDECRNSELIKCCYERCVTPLDLVVIMDSSGSIDPSDYKRGLEFMKNLINYLKMENANQSRAAILKYSNSTTIAANLTYNKLELNKIIDNLTHEKGYTNTQEALKLANDAVLQESNGMRGENETVSKVVMLITDGFSNINQSLTVPNAKIIKDRGFTIISIGIGSGIQKAEMQSIASNERTYFVLDTYETAQTLAGPIFAVACHQGIKVSTNRTIPLESALNESVRIDLNTQSAEQSEMPSEIREMNSTSNSSRTKRENNEDLENVFRIYVTNLEGQVDFFSDTGSINKVEEVRKKRDSETGYLHATYEVRTEKDTEWLILGTVGKEEKNKYELTGYKLGYLHGIVDLSGDNGQMSIHKTKLAFIFAIIINFIILML